MQHSHLAMFIGSVLNVNSLTFKMTAMVQVNIVQSSHQTKDLKAERLYWRTYVKNACTKVYKHKIKHYSGLTILKEYIRLATLLSMKIAVNEHFNTYH
jgi:hypothetical protein